LVIDDISSREDDVSSREDACSEAPSARRWLDSDTVAPGHDPNPPRDRKH